MIKGFFEFFDKLEDKIRGSLSHYPVAYAIIGGIGIVLFWRGVWHMADDIALSSFESILLGATILLATGLFVSFFVGENIIITGIRRERKLMDKTESELKEEVHDLREIKEEIKKIEIEIKEMRDEKLSM